MILVQMSTTPNWSRAQTGRLGLTLEEGGEVLVEDDVGVEHDRAPPHLPHAVPLAQHVLATAGEELMTRLQVRARGLAVMSLPTD